MSDHFLAEHNPIFDPILDEAHSFATDHLGLHVADKSQVAIVDEQHAAEVRSRLGIKTVASYNTKTGQVVMFVEGDTSRSQGATAKIGSLMTHELVHTSTGNTAEHPFYIEALAGLGEITYLQWLKVQGRWQPPSDYVLRRVGVKLWVPGTFRYDETDNPDKPTNSSQGLIAALGVSLAMQRAGIKISDIMAASTFGGDKQFGLMKHALDSLQPGLAEEVESFHRSTDGIFEAVAAIQDTASRLDLIR